MDLNGGFLMNGSVCWSGSAFGSSAQKHLGVRLVIEEMGQFTLF